MPPTSSNSVNKCRGYLHSNQYGLKRFRLPLRKQASHNTAKQLYRCLDILSPMPKPELSVYTMLALQLMFAPRTSVEGSLSQLTRVGRCPTTASKSLEAVVPAIPALRYQLGFAGDALAYLTPSAIRRCSTPNAHPTQDISSCRWSDPLPAPLL